MKGWLDRLAWWWIGKRFKEQLPAHCLKGHRAQKAMWGQRCAVCDDDPYNIGTRLRIGMGKFSRDDHTAA